ncbi:MAG: hypothetical protein JXB15_07860 [Anaerolineales bacterium]|nr:hypothetical protein [Anaerolineales bacterium]
MSAIESVPHPLDKTVHDPVWKPLFILGGIAALLAVFVFRRNLGAELVAFQGFGIFTLPEPYPIHAGDWFALLQSDPLVGFILLGFFDLVEYGLVGLIFLAVGVILWRASRAAVLLAGLCGLVGITLSFASNQAFALHSLSQRCVEAGSNAQRLICQAAGEALLAIHEHSISTYASLFLVLLAGLLLSAVMLRNSVFSRAAAVTGLLANGFGLVYFIALIFAPAFIWIPPTISAPFRMIWYFLIAIQLFRMGKKI